MNDHFLDRDDAVLIAKKLRDKLPTFLKERPETISGCREYTGSVWAFFNDFASDPIRNWKIYPPQEPKAGRGKGEYLVDFSLFDAERGCRIACESDWGDRSSVDWAFDKLRGLKADVKILIFEAAHQKDKALAYREHFADYLCNSHHHCPGRESYIFIQFDHGKCRIYLWQPNSNGPLAPGSVNFELIEDFVS